MDKIAINWAERHLCCCCKRQAYLERVTARDFKKSSRLGPRKLCSRLKKGHVSEPVPSASCQTVTSPALRSHSSLPVHRPCSPSPICGRPLRPLRIQPQRRRDLPPWRKSCGRRRSPPSAVQPQRATRGRRGAPPRSVYRHAGPASTANSVAAALWTASSTSSGLPGGPRESRRQWAPMQVVAERRISVGRLRRGAGRRPRGGHAQEPACVGKLVRPLHVQKHNHLRFAALLQRQGGPKGEGEIVLVPLTPPPPSLPEPLPPPLLVALIEPSVRVSVGGGGVLLVRSVACS
jgi:hypothetical protein